MVSIVCLEESYSPTHGDRRDAVKDSYDRGRQCQAQLVFQQLRDIHIRLLTLAIPDWPAFFRCCWDHLNPGGSIELANASIRYRVENPATNCESSVFLRMGFLYYESRLRDGIDMMAAHRHSDRLKL